jgi:hypothetical protein
MTIQLSWKRAWVSRQDLHIRVLSLRSIKFIYIFLKFSSHFKENAVFLHDNDQLFNGL